MGKKENKKAQAAIELSVFGAILIFILGTIVRSAVGNGYAQNANFKAMRMAMLASWRYSEMSQGNGARAHTSHNSASILFVEDRLSPDFNKFGSVDRSPFIAQGSGTFSYELLYPLTDTQDILASMPVMDVWINGQHFPFSTASYVTDKTICRPGVGNCPACPGNVAELPSLAQTQCLTSGQTPQQCQNAAQQQCAINQCLRNQREWAGGIVRESDFYDVIPVTALNAATIANNASTIFNAMKGANLIVNVTGTDLIQGGTGLTGNVAALPPSGNFISTPQAMALDLTRAQADQIQTILRTDQHQYKLFYSLAVNGTPQFLPTTPICASVPDTNQALCSSLVTVNNQGAAGTWNGIDPTTGADHSGDMMYDLLRFADYSATTGVESSSQLGLPVTSCSNVAIAPNMRCLIAWQWNASAATDAKSIGLDVSGNNYPQYDIDGRLKTVTVYGINQNSDGTPSVTYEDFQGGDIDSSWDSNSCGPKPGLQSDSQIYTFTKDGTFLQIKEGKLYNPETDQFVRSANLRNTIDLIQRTIQLSNNTYRFCDQNGNRLSTVANDGVTPNPVEVCIPPGSADNCFSNEQNIKSTCYDTNPVINKIFVRSRLEDRRGHSWMTDTSGQLKVQ